MAVVNTESRVHPLSVKLTVECPFCAEQLTDNWPDLRSSNAFGRKEVDLSFRCKMNHRFTVRVNFTVLQD